MDGVYAGTIAGGSHNTDSGPTTTLRSRRRLPRTPLQGIPVFWAGEFLLRVQLILPGSPRRRSAQKMAKTRSQSEAQMELQNLIQDMKTDLAQQAVQTGSAAPAYQNSRNGAPVAEC